MGHFKAEHQITFWEAISGTDYSDSIVAIRGVDDPNMGVSESISLRVIELMLPTTREKADTSDIPSHNKLLLRSNGWHIPGKTKQRLCKFACHMPDCNRYGLNSVAACLAHLHEAHTLSHCEFTLQHRTGFDNNVSFALPPQDPCHICAENLVTKDALSTHLDTDHGVGLADVERDNYLQGLGTRHDLLNKVSMPVHSHPNVFLLI